MAAIHQWSESNLVGQVETIPITNINFGSDDSADLNTLTYPVTVGENSFSKYIRCKFTSIFTDISNMKFWLSTVIYKTGELIKASANATYGTPSKTSTGDSTIPTTEGTALAINSAEGANHIEYGASGVSGYTGYVRLQTQTTGSTPAGAGNTKIFTFQYDEV